METQPSQENVGSSLKDPQKENPVSIFILDENESERCEFWVGLFSKGPNSPNQLFYKGSILDALELAGKDGLEEAVPIMLSDTTKPPVKYIYLLPPLGEDPLNDEDWIKNIIQAIEAAKPELAGIYLSKNAMLNPEVAAESLTKLMTEVIKRSDIKNLALFPGDYGTNTVLNVALAIKSKFSTETHPITVFH